MVLITDKCFIVLVISSSYQRIISLNSVGGLEDDAQPVDSPMSIYTLKCSIFNMKYCFMHRRCARRSNIAERAWIHSRANVEYIGFCVSERSNVGKFDCLRTSEFCGKLICLFINYFTWEKKEAFLISKVIKINFVVSQ